MPEITPLQQAAYLAHARTAGFKRKLDRSRDLIARNSDHCLSVSWGKDSVVMLHIAHSVLGNLRAVHGRYKTECERFEDIDAVRDAVLDKLPGVDYFEAEVTGNWQMYELAGGFFVEPETPEQNKAHAWYRSQWALEIAAMTCDKVMIGMRPDESRTRRMVVARFGAEYTTKTGRSTALPLVGWSGKDVWTYLISNNLPWLRIYDVQQNRETARSDFAFGEKGVSGRLMMQGQWLDWAEAYPRHFGEWVQAWPEMRQICGYI